MMRSLLTALCLLFLVGIVGGCAEQPAEQPAVDVPTPRMPADWQVVENFLVSPAELEMFSSKMNAKLLGARNTSFNVQGRPMKVNTIITPGTADAEKVMSYMKGMKSEEGLLQRGTTVYEFVGTNEVNDLVRLARQHLNQSP